MQLFLRHVNGRTVAIHVHPRHLVAQLKCMSTSLAPPSLCKELYVLHSGRVLSDDRLLSDYGVQDCDTLTLGLKCHGGGGDGGATGAESRDCYLKMYADKKPDKFDPYEAKLAKFTRCTLSAEALKPPCVMDYVGNLYNKEVVVQALLTKSLPKTLKHVIKGLKDVIDIHLSSIPGISPEDESVGTKFHCPITSLEFNGKFRFFALKRCGHVLSEKALKEVRTSSCLVCYAPFHESDKIVINGTEEEVLALRERRDEEKAKSREEKKEKKSQNVLETVVAKESYEAIKDDDTRSDRPRPAAAQISKRKPETAIQVPEVEVARPKGSDLIKPSKKFKAAEVLLPTNATKQVYASIFTSSSKSDLKETYSCRSLPIGRN